MRYLVGSTLALVVLAGCSSESNGVAPTAGTAIAGSTAASHSAAAPPQGPFKRGQVTSKTRVTAKGPKLEVTAPARGAIVSQDRVLVRVDATDPDGVQSVTIAGVPARFAGGDAYEATVDLAPGANVIECVALDGKNDRSRARFQVVRGTAATAGAVLDGAIGANLSPAALAFASQQGSALAAKVDLLPLLTKKNPIWEGFGASASVVSIRHKPIALALDGDPRGALVTARLDDVVVGLEIKFAGARLGDASIEADRATLVAAALIEPIAVRKTKLGLVMKDPQATFDNFRVGAASGLLGTVLGWAKGTIETKVREHLEQAVLDHLPPILAAAKIPGVDHPVTMPIGIPGLGPTPVNLTVVPGRASGDKARGLDLEAGLALAPTHPAPAWPAGVFVTGVRAPAGNAGGAVTVSLSQDAANAFVDALGRTGALKYAVDAKTMTGSSTLPLSVKMLYPFFKPVQELAPDKDTPVALRVAAKTSPIVLLEKGRVRLEAGELELSVLIDFMDGGPELELVGLRLALTAEATLQVDGQTLRVEDLKLVRFTSDVIREPAADLADAEIETFLDAIVPKLLDQYKVQVPPITIPGLPAGIVLERPGLSIQNGFLVAWGDL